MCVQVAFEVGQHIRSDRSFHLLSAMPRNHSVEQKFARADAQEVKAGKSIADAYYSKCLRVLKEIPESRKECAELLDKWVKRRNPEPGAEVIE